ncbi:MAG: hypothetical protein K6F09_05875 [Clostridiales bacterium]|nr:hypothetical protein [Clostridiales bacterium]
MRCRSCNIDLGEEYVRCPLCGEKASPDEPVLSGLRTAEYPDIKYRKNPKSAFLIYVIIYAILCSAAIVADLIINRRVSDSLWAVFLLPCVWAILFRPLFIHKLYIGSYIMQDAIYISVFMLWCAKSYMRDFSYAIYSGVPMICTISAVLIFVGIFLFPEKRVTALSYFIALFVIGLITLIISLACGYNCVLPAACTVSSNLFITVLAMLEPNEVRGELIARFRA